MKLALFLLPQVSQLIYVRLSKGKKVGLKVSVNPAKVYSCTYLEYPVDDDDDRMEQERREKS